MTPIETSLRSDTVARQPQAANGLALVRLTIGAMFVSVFFENLGKGLYTAKGYAGLINYYIKASHSPATWKTVMSLAASHAAIAAPMQGITEISLGILLVIGLLTRPAAFVAFLLSRQSLDFGVGHRVDLGSCWFRCSPRSGSPSEAPAGDGASTRGCRNGGHLLRGGNRANTCAYPSSSPPIMKRRRLSAYWRISRPNLTTEVIVVDSNSNDGTPEIAARMGARVVQEPRRGYGRACLTGMAAANSPDVVVFLDGDYSDRPSELPILLAPITEGRADITLGSRLQKRRTAGALPWHQVFGNRLAASLIRLLYGLEISDLGPFRAGRADVLRALALEETTYGWAVEMILKGALAGFRVVEVPVSYYPRIGKSKISGTLKGTIGAGWFILSLIVRYYFRHLVRYYFRCRRTGHHGQRKSASKFYEIRKRDGGLVRQ